MRIILLNVRHGGGYRAPKLLDWLTLLAADLVVIPEWRNNTPGGVIKGAFEARGYYVATQCASDIRANGILVAAKQTFRTTRITPLGTNKGELMLADFASGWSLLAAYFPQANAKIPFFMSCVDTARRFDNVPFLLLGDLNTGRNKADVEGGGVPFVCSDLFDALQTKGALVDLWRIEHGDKREWSWRSPLNGFRVDHALANAAFRRRFPAMRCMYDHGPRETGLTDHSALILAELVSNEIDLNGDGED
jgi:exodeoxyribonuclease III